MEFYDDFSSGLRSSEWGAWGQPRPYVDSNAKLHIPFDPTLTKGTAGATWQHPFTFGTFTMRVRRTVGNFKICPLLWPDAPVWPPEVDIAEGPDHLNPHQTVHYGLGPDDNQMIHRSYALAAPGLSAWTVLKTIWSPDVVSFLVNGSIKSEIKSTHDPDIPMKMHLQVGHSSLPGEEAGQLLVDWVSLSTD